MAIGGSTLEGSEVGLAVARSGAAGEELQGALLVAKGPGSAAERFSAAAISNSNADGSVGPLPLVSGVGATEEELEAMLLASGGPSFGVATVGLAAFFPTVGGSQAASVTYRPGTSPASILKSDPELLSFATGPEHLPVYAATFGGGEGAICFGGAAMAAQAAAGGGAMGLALAPSRFDLQGGSTALPDGGSPANKFVNRTKRNPFESIDRCSESSSEMVKRTKYLVRNPYH